MNQEIVISFPQELLDGIKIERRYRKGRTEDSLVFVYEDIEVLAGIMKTAQAAIRTVQGK
jgi:hypothetical protein